MAESEVISMYKEKRMEAVRRIKGFPKNLEGAAQILNVGTATLSRYENGKTEVPAGLVLDMEIRYQAEGLANWHCCNKCPIGQKKMVPIEYKNFENTAINLRLKLKKAYGYSERLLEIAATGSVNCSERGEFLEIVKVCCNDLSEPIQELKHFANQQGIL